MRYLATLQTLLIMLFLGQPVVVTANVSAMTLEDVITLAIEHDAQLRAEQYLAEAQKADGWKSIAEYGPVLNVSGSYMRSRDFSNPKNDPEIENRVAHINEPGMTIGFNQPLVDMEKLSNVYKGVADLTVADLSKKKALEDLLLRVHERYYNALSSKESLGLAIAESAALKSQRDAAKERLELGFGTITDQYNAEARYRLSLASEISQRTTLENDIKAIEEIINQRVKEELEDSKQDRYLPCLPENLDQWLDIAKQNNTDLNLKKMQVEIARLEYRAVQSRFLPSLVLFADYSERHPDDGLLGYGEERTELDVGFRIDMNLLSGGRDTAETVAASRRKSAAWEQAVATERSTERSVRSLWDSIEGTRELIGAYQMASEANRLAMESTQASYDEGVKVLLDVLNAQQDYFRSLKEYRVTRYDYLILIEKFRIVVGVDDVINV